MARTDWQMGDTVEPADMNQIGQEINDAAAAADAAQSDIDAHKASTKPHVTLQGLEKIGFYYPAPTLTISDGAITVSHSYHTIDTEGGAATDELVTINGGNTGDLLILRQVDSSRDITIRGDGSGGSNIYTFDRTSITLDTNTSSVILLKFNSTHWLVIGVQGVKRSGDTIKGIEGLGLKAPTNLMISNGSIAPTQSFHFVDTEGQASSDELENIVGGEVGDVLFLTQYTSSRTITVKHGVGNIRTIGGSDFTLGGNGTAGPVMFLKINTSHWFAVGIQGVKRSGDTMTGSLSIQTPDNTFATIYGVYGRDESGNIKWQAGYNPSNGSYLIYDYEAASSRLAILPNGEVRIPFGVLYVGSARIIAGSGSPEGVISAPVGSMYLRTDGGTNSTLYVKEFGSGNTGWVAK